MALTDPNLGLVYGWQQGENNWHTGMDANLKRLGAVVGLSVKDRDIATPPATPVDGDRYIIPASANGDWAGHEGQVAVRVAGTWEYHAPAVGWVAYIEDEGKQIIYTASGWMLVDDVLGLGTMATQDANNVNITGGQINADITGGTFHGVTPTQAGLDFLDDADAAAQRQTLGLGTAATKDVGTSGNTVPVLDGNNTFSGTTVFNGRVGFGDTPGAGVNRLYFFDTITDSTYASLHAWVNVDESSGASTHSCFNFVTAIATNYGGSGPVLGITSKTRVSSANTVQQTRNYTSDFYIENGGTVTYRYGVYDSGLNLTNGTVTNNYAFYAGPANVGATNNYGFYSNIPAGAGRWNFYAGGTAQNRFQGRTIFNSGFARIPTVSTAPDGSTITLTVSINHLLYNNASSVAALTIKLPTDTWIDGQEITIATRSAITTLTINAGSKPVYGAPTSLPAGGFATFIYSSAADAWFRKG